MTGAAGTMTNQIDHIDENGLFVPRSIVGDDFELVPKEFDPVALSRCVYREHQLHKILESLKEKAGKPNDPGLYLQGPLGVGKSVLVYMIAQLAKFDLGWLTIYIPSCDTWKDHCPTVGKGYFLDRVLDAFSESKLQNKFPQVFQLLQDNDQKFSADDQTDSTKISSSSYWRTMAEMRNDHDRVNRTFVHIKNFLYGETGDTLVLLVVDESNLLWDQHGNNAYLDKQPWKLLSFHSPSFRNGATLVSGSTDCEFVNTIPAGVADHSILTIPPMSPTEVDQMLKIPLCKPLDLLRKFDSDLLRSIIDSSGGIPREINLWSLWFGGFEVEAIQNELTDQGITSDSTRKRKCCEVLENESASVNDDATRKRLKTEIERGIKERNGNGELDHESMMNAVIKREQRERVDIYRKALWDWCKSFYLHSNSEGSDEILRVPNLIKRNGNQFFPTTNAASHVYFKWFLTQAKQKGDEDLSIAMDYKTSCSKGETEGVRGHAFERYLAAKLMMSGNTTLHTHRLDDHTVTQHLSMEVNDRVFTTSQRPPRNFRSYRSGTLLTHVDQDGGEHRIDIIYYGRDDVIFLETTVGNYRDSKIPTEDDSKDVAGKILHRMNKWLGETVYEVTLESNGLEVAYKKAHTSRANSNRPGLPRVHYVVVTTCPQSIQASDKRKKKYDWIRVSFLEDLVESGLIPADGVGKILEAQGADAGHVE